MPNEQASSEPATDRPCVGIDVAKDKLDGRVLPGGEHRGFANDPAGHAKLVAWLQKWPGCLVVLEATGGYERAAMLALQDAGVDVALVNPRQVRRFAEGIGELAKTDKLDAAVLAQFGRIVSPEPAEETTAKQRELSGLVARRRQLLELRVMESNRLKQATDKYIQGDLRKVIRLLDKQLKAIEDRIAELLQSDDQWRAKLDLLESVPGIGKTIAATLVAELPELGRVNRQELASLVGVAPFANDSGQSRGQRRVRWGRREVRSALYMGALSARRHNPKIRAFAQRLAKAGKSFKAIQIACVRKLLVILNNMVKNNSHWIKPQEKG